VTSSFTLGFAVFAMVYAGTGLGTLFALFLPSQYLDDRSKSVIAVATHGGGNRVSADLNRQHSLLATRRWGDEDGDRHHPARSGAP
jgi:hypothetical protein